MTLCQSSWMVLRYFKRAPLHTLIMARKIKLSTCVVSVNQFELAVVPTIDPIPQCRPISLLIMFRFEVTLTIRIIVRFPPIWGFGL